MPYMYAAHYVHSTNYYLVILKIIFGIYTRSQQMKRKFECQKDISQSVERSVAQLVQRWSRDPASRVQRCDVTLSNATSWIWPVIVDFHACPCVYWSLVKARKIVWESQVIDSSSITQSEALWVWRCDVTASNSIQDGGTLVVNILVFDLRVQLQHCTYQRKTLLFALIKVNTFICKREISGFSWFNNKLYSNVNYI